MMCQFHGSNGNGLGDIWWTDKFFYISIIDSWIQLNCITCCLLCKTVILIDWGNFILYHTIKLNNSKNYYSLDFKLTNFCDFWNYLTFCEKKMCRNHFSLRNVRNKIAGIPAVR